MLIHKRAMIVSLFGALLLFACGGGGSDPVSAGGGTSKIIFQDDFSSNNGAWDVLLNDPDLLLEYYDGGYRMTAIKKNVVYSSVPNFVFPTDVSIEADIAQTAGTENAAMGIICRYTYSANSESMYFFMIYTDGTAEIAKYVTGQKTFLAGRSPFISINPGITTNRTGTYRTGNRTNHMRVDCVGNTFTMYVNGTQLFSVTDNSLVQGDAGLMIGTSDEEDAVVLFDNFVVSKP